MREDKGIPIGQAIRSLGDCLHILQDWVLRAYRVEFWSVGHETLLRGWSPKTSRMGLAPRLVCIDVGDQPAGDTDPFETAFFFC